MSGAVAKTNGAAFQAGFAQLAPKIKAALPSHISLEKFERVVMMAVQKEPKLLECDQRSLFLECQKAASDGILPDGREGVIVFRWNSKLGKNLAVYQPMVGGLMKLARNSGEIASLTSQVVYEGETFLVTLGDEENIKHERRMDLPGDARVVAAYAVATLKNGEKQREVLTLAQIEKIRAANPNWQKGPWVGWMDEMARKSAMRRLIKKLPISTDRDSDARLQSAVERDDATETTFTEMPATPANPPQGGKLDALEFDAETGEVFGEQEEIQTEPSPLDSLILAIDSATDETSLLAVTNIPANRKLVRSLAPAEQERVKTATEAAYASFKRKPAADPDDTASLDQIARGYGTDNVMAG